MKVAILLLILLNGCCCLNISVNMDIQAVLGPSEVQINCSYTLDPGDVLFAVNLKALIGGLYRTIATFAGPTIPSPPAFTSDGLYLVSRANLTNPSVQSATATLTFSEIECVDETEYQCEYNFADSGGNTPSPLPFVSTNVTVKVAAERPDTVPDISVEYDEVREGRNVTFTCTGNVGYPAGIFVWEKYRRIGFFPTTYPNEPTIISTPRLNCTYNGTSSLTIPLEEEDDMCIIRCVIIQELVSGLFQSTSPIPVIYSVRNTNVLRSPDQSAYFEGSDPITLICGSAGNPEPTFTWYREGSDTILSNTSTLVISNVSIENTGNYTCVTENIIDGIVYNESVTTRVIIRAKDSSITAGDKDPQTNTLQDTLPAIIGGSVGAFLAVVVSVGLCKYSFGKKGKFSGNVQGQNINSATNGQKSTNQTHLDMYNSIEMSAIRGVKL